MTSEATSCAMSAGRVRFGYRRLNRVRHVVQVLAFALMAVAPLLVLSGRHWLLGSYYSWTVAGVEITDPAMAVQTLLLDRGFFVPMLAGLVIPLVAALALGKVFCSWVCPQNTLSEWMSALEKRWGRRRWRARRQRVASGNPPAALYWWMLAGVLLVTVVTALPMVALLSAPGILSSQLSRLLLGAGVGVELGLIAAILAAEFLLGRRVWCKYVCPVGACLSLVRTPATMTLAHDPARCHCPAGSEPCHLSCPLGLAPTRAGIYPYCIQCGVCAAACERTRRGSLGFRFGPDKSL